MKTINIHFFSTVFLLAVNFFSFGSAHQLSLLSLETLKFSTAFEFVLTDSNDLEYDMNNLRAAPIIDIWYGDTQEFGNNGEPQVWCNIMGNITDDGTISSFTYSLNGGTDINLSIGPDNRRLVNSGDFNIDIDVSDLLPGTNIILITATDNDLETTTKTVNINYTDGNVWPIPYNVDWSSLNNDITRINEVAHVVDGKFLLTPNGIRTEETGYDRLIAIGDKTSTNYEVLVPITIHSMSSDGGVGVLLRWKGHTDTPVVCPQPKCGYFPLGAISWFRANRLEFYQGANSSFTPVIDVTYMFRTSVETNANTGITTYRIKFWEQVTSEPSAWNLEQTEGPSDEQQGSLMLIAHKADVTFGNVTVNPGALSISNVQTQLANNYTEATITWDTNQPTTSRVDYGPTVAYENGNVEDTNLVTAHSITLTGLSPDTIYQYKISGETNGMEVVERTGQVLSTFTSGIQSDDFCGNTLDPVWTFNNPLGDCSYALTGSGTEDALLEISVPAGSEHQIFTSGINAPNLMQSINNSDFEVEVKFQNGVIAPQYQQQGILVKQSNSRFIRFEFYSTNSNQTNLYAQAFDSGSAQTAYVNTSITASGTAPLYMRVKRESNQWTLSHSFDGTNFTVGTTFFNDMVPTQIGPYAGNAIGGSSPAHTAKIDYFVNLAEPIIAEDGCDVQLPPVLASIGDQTVEEGTSLSLTLTATDADGTDSDIDFTETGLPIFATLNDNNDGTASLAMNPQVGDEGIYPVTITVTDSDGLTANEEFDIIVSLPEEVSNLISDDFCDSVLNPVWTFNDPLGDGGSSTLVGSGTADALLEIAVPSGNDHELWRNGIEAPHIIQTSNNSDFELEIKMESPVNSPQFQQQGIIVKQDDYNFLRFEFSSSSSKTKALSVILKSDTNLFPLQSAIPVNIIIGDLDIAPLYMRVKREGNQWTQSYSLNGTTWTVAGTFSHSMVVNGVGLFAGNAGENPAHTAQFDYFKNLANPIISEDGCDVQQPPVLAFIGDKTIEEGTSLSLTLTATDADGTDSDIDFTETGLPIFATLNDNNDGTASLVINPQVGDEGTYPVTITVTDSDGLTDNEEFDIIVSLPEEVSNLISDDFCDSVLNPVWTFNDPLADGGSSTLVGSGTADALLEIAVPSGNDHELWINGIEAPHIIQTSNNSDFELEIKMESPVNSPQFQQQGIIVKQDDYNFLRFEFSSSSSKTKALSVILKSDTNLFPLQSAIPVNIIIGDLDIAPLYMRVKREGNQWTQSYSLNGTTWTVAGTFSHSMVVNGVGLFAGNAGENPAHTAQFDYFKNLANPIISEDGCAPCPDGLTTTWNGSVSSDWNEPNNWTPSGIPTSCSEMTIPITANNPIVAGVTIIKDLTIDSGANVLVPVGATLNISGDLNMYSTSNTFSGLVSKGDLIVEGNAKYHRYVNANANLNGNDLISPPFDGQSWSSFLTSDSNSNANALHQNSIAEPNTTYLFGPFEKGSTDNYLVYNYNSLETLTSGRGYRVGTSIPVDESNGQSLIFTGSVVTESVGRTIENDVTGNFPEWNLIGNPYPAYIDVNAFLNHEGSVSGVSNLNLLKEFSAAIYGYDADNTDGSIWTITNFLQGPALIAPGQGFFVSSENSSATLEFTPDMQVEGNSDDFIEARTSQPTDFLKIKVNTPSKSYLTSIYFHENGSAGLDVGYDAAIFGGNVGAFGLYSHLVQGNQGIPMAIQTLNSEDLNDVIIPLGLNATMGQQITFSIDDYALPSSVEVYLEDTLENTFTLLSDTNYVFTSSTAVNGTGRFFLRFTSGTLSMNENNLNMLNIYSNLSDRTIVIEGNLSKETEASIYDLLGREVIWQQLETAQTKNIININNLSSGVYVVELQNGIQQLAKKIIIK